MPNEFIVEFECPQCGAPASLEETSRLLICKYCSVKSYLVPKDVFHYVFAHKASENKEIIYFPFWRPHQDMKATFQISVSCAMLHHATTPPLQQSAGYLVVTTHAG